MAFTARPQQSIFCSMKLGERKSYRVVPLATKLLKKPKSYKSNICISSPNNIREIDSCVRFKSTVMSALRDIHQPTAHNSGTVKPGDKEMESNKGTTRVSWVDLYLPKRARPYARLARIDRPIVTWLFVWPSFWAIALAASPGNLPDLGLLALFGIASFPIRGYGCTINDLLDRDIDQKVKRSKNRPIASGDVTQLQGLLFLLLQLFACFAILLPGLNTFSKVVGVPFFPLVSLYPLMKRVTYWPQAYLGASMNWLALVAWTRVKGRFDLPVLVPLYISLVVWTLAYDTIYAHQDRAEDVKAGVKSTAVLFGDSTKIWCAVLNIMCISSLAICGFIAKIGWPFYASLVAAAGHLGWQILTVDLSNSNDCKKKFISNIWVGAIVFFGICLGKLMY